METKDAIMQISLMEKDIKQMKRFKGQAAILSSLQKKIDFLTRFKVDGSNIPELITKEAEREIMRGL